MSVEGSATPSEAVLAEASSAPAEGQTTPAAEAQKPDDKFAPKFAALSRKEKELRQREQQYQTESQKIAQEKAELEKWRQEKTATESAFQKKLKNNPLQTLQELGITFEELTQMQLNEQNPTPEMLIKRTREELEQGYKSELEELRNAMKQKEQDAEQKQFEETVSGFKSQIADFVDSNADTYELIKMNDAQELVFDVIQEYYQSSGRILTIEEAAKHTEEHLEAEARKVLEAKKFKQTSPQVKPGTQTSPTLSNALSSEAPAQGTKKLSREESLAQAAKMIRWNE